MPPAPAAPARYIRQVDEKAAAASSNGPRAPSRGEGGGAEEGAGKPKRKRGNGTPIEALSAARAPRRRSLLLQAACEDQQGSARRTPGSSWAGAGLQDAPREYCMYPGHTVISRPVQRPRVPLPFQNLVPKGSRKQPDRPSLHLCPQCAAVARGHGQTRRPAGEKISHPPAVRLRLASIRHFDGGQTR